MISNDSTSPDRGRFAFWAAAGTALTTLATFIVAFLTPPLSGPLCASGCFQYPFADVAGRFPRDYYWLFPALLANLFYLAWVVALAARAPAAGRAPAQLGVVLAAMAAITLLADYFVQLAVIQPSLLAGERDGIALLSQYNPHGLFIALEELGYLLISLSLVCLVPALTSATRLERTIRRLLVSGFVVNMGALTFFLARYGHQRAYRFELAVISVDWLVVIVTATLTALLVRRAGSQRPHSGVAS